MRLDEFSIPDGSLSTADLARFLLFGFDITLGAPAGIDFTNSIIHTCVRRGDIIQTATQKTNILNQAQQKGDIIYTVTRGGTR